jgi:hypothetical protein
MRLFSVGMNQKLAKNIAVFNLLRGVTCIGKTPACDGIEIYWKDKNGKEHRNRFRCYADKAEVLRPNVRLSRARNTFLAMHSQEFEEMVIKELTHLQAQGVRKVRVHESGDFFNQKYLDTWVGIVKQFPDMRFLAYTRSFQLNWAEAKKLKNFIILWSIDKTTTLPVPKGNRVYIKYPNEPIPANAKTCSHKSKYNYCGRECNLCWKLNEAKKKYDIYFNAH